ncbi:MAG TPA: C1 family peptidase [Candidatus Ozemobacteraceae bacterium]|nr:C1 family peptidase [Candidatus Ozemobacteraceae bacterium]
MSSTVRTAFLAVALAVLPLAPGMPAFGATASATQFTGVVPMTDEQFLAIQEVRMVRKFTTLSGKPDVNLPPAVDLSPDFPPVGKQFDNTCPGWAVAYAVKSYHEKLEHGWNYGPNHIFSPTFITNLLYKSPDENGFRDHNALFLSIDVGCVPLSLFPYIPDDETVPSEDLRTFARAFRNLTFRRLPYGDIPTLKAILAGGDPVVCTMDIYSEFYKLNKKNPILKKITDTTIDSVHYLVIVGYDDKRHALKLYNSWGTEWGDNGTAWLDYDLYGKIVTHPVVLYDRPTPQDVVNYLADPHKKPETPLPSFEMPEIVLRRALRADDNPEALQKSLKDYSSYVPPADPSPPEWKAAPADEPLLIVPEEAGILVGENWLRLGDPLARAESFFSTSVSPKFAEYQKYGDDALVTQSFMDATAVGRIDLFGAKRTRVMTSRGVGIGTPKSRVRQVYRKPDMTVNDGRSETYFYRSAAKDWGGVKAVTSIGLEFRYGADKNVEGVSVFTAFVPAYTNTALKPISDAEVTKSKSPTKGDRVESREGGFAFTVPECFSRADKVVWPGIGVGYFIKGHVMRDSWMVTVKAFDVPGADRERLLAERIPADMKVYAMLGLGAPKPVTMGGTEWFVVEDAAGVFTNYYAVTPNRYYQVNIATDQPARDEPWVKEFFESITFTK